MLREINDDPTHLFGYDRRENTGYVLPRYMFEHLGNFRDHVSKLFSTPGNPFIPFDTTPRSGATPDGDRGTDAPAGRSRDHPQRSQNRCDAAYGQDGGAPFDQIGYGARIGEDEIAGET
jgi:hypothetical protein